MPEYPLLALRPRACITIISLLRLRSPLCAIASTCVSVVLGTPTASLPKVRLRSSGWWLSQTANGSRSSPSLVLGYYVLSWQQSSSNWGIRQVTEDVPSSEKRRWGARTGCPTCLPTSGSDQRGQGAYTEGMAARALRPSRCLTTTFSLCKKRSRQH